MSRSSRNVSAASEDTQKTESHYRQGLTMSTVERSSMSGTPSARSMSPATSLKSSATSGKPSDAVSVDTGRTSAKPSDAISVATTAKTGYTNTTGMTANTSVSQQPPGGGTSINRAPVLQHQLSGANTGVINQPVQINTTSEYHQYQRHVVQPEINLHSGSSESSRGGTLSSAGNTFVQQQPRFDLAKAIFTQADANRDGSISREEFRQWAQTGQAHYQQNPQFMNQNPRQQTSNVFRDNIFLIDYSAMEAYNFGIRSANNSFAAQSPGDFGQGGQKIDVAKAIFNQADINHDGRISREEFQQWAQHGQPNFGGQSYSNYQTTANIGNNINHTRLFAGATPDIANILQQSGLGQGLTNYS